MNRTEQIEKLKRAESGLVRLGQLAIVRASPEFQGIVVALLDVVKIVRDIVEGRNAEAPEKS